MNALGRSRGGYTIKIQARCDNQGLPVCFILTGGEASDYAAAEPLMAIPLERSKHCWRTRAMMTIASAKAC